MSIVQMNNSVNEFYPYLIKKVDEEFYYYNIMTGSIFQMDNESYEVLVNNGEMNSQNNKDMISFFEKNFILVTEENKGMLNNLYNNTVEKKKSMNATGLTLMITQECNLRCKYCYGENGEYSNKGKMDFETAKNAIDYFAEKAPANKLDICFFGGEPLMNFSLIKKVIEYTKIVEEKSNKKFGFSMTTNATLIDEEIKKYLNENKIYLTVSLDGKKAHNDANRYYENKNGIYNHIKENTKDLKKNITIRATVSAPNLNIYESSTHIIEELGFNKVAWAEADNLLTEEDYSELAISTNALIDKLEDDIKMQKYKEVKKYHTFMNILKKFDSDGIRSKGCGAGSNLIAVDIRGNIFPCHRFVGIDDYILGNVNEADAKRNETFYDTVDLANFDSCTYCVAKNICGGGCINENFYATNSINKPSEKHCTYKISVFDRMLETYIRLDDYSKKVLLGER